MSSTFAQETVTYASRIRLFDASDWLAYASWVGLLLGNLLMVAGFLALGVSHGVGFPDYVWNVLGGTAVLVLAVGFDTIGHRTVYKDELAKGELLVHHMAIFAGVASVLCLGAGYAYPGLMRIPALTFSVVNFIYSLVDEWLHWRRYFSGSCDRVESWCHFFIFVGHLTMIFGWWAWYEDGFPGVRETLGLFA